MCACRKLASDIARGLQSGIWNARSEYGETLGQYVEDLLNKHDEGNFLLADARARIIRAMFTADLPSLPLGLAAHLETLLVQHIGLRAYYSETGDFYQSVRSGHLEAPLPVDAIEGFIERVRALTPAYFEPSVPQSLQYVAQPIPTITHPVIGARLRAMFQSAPPPDLLGEVDLEKSRRLTIGGAINELVKVIESGDKIGKGAKGWREAANTLAPYAAPILQWLRVFLGGG
ncbi:MAG TPA: hypothetical protein VFG05_07105 [Methylocella sp.]|nr:hypothetical protein [Methylocella sp.]